MQLRSEHYGKIVRVFVRSCLPEDNHLFTALNVPESAMVVVCARRTAPSDGMRVSFRSPSCSTTKDRVGAVPPAHENDSGALYAQLRCRTRHDQRLGPSDAQEAGASL